MKNEMSRRQFLGFAGSAAAVLGLGLVGCGGSAGSGSSASGDAAEVYFLQFKPEVDKEWKEIAKAYKKEKGVEVKIVTAASNTYEEKLKSEMSKSSAPTLFQVNGPTGLKNWKDYCADLSDTKLRGELIDDSLALQSDGKDLGIDWVQESYGIIYNKQLLEKAGYKAEDINSFDKLKACADDIQARKDELGVEGAFTSAGMDGSSAGAIPPIWLDLYINNSTCDPTELAGKTGDDSRNEFLNDEAVFFQNGSWEYTNLVGDGKPFTDDDLTMLPIYIGVGDEANQGLCTGTENYWCVNKEASEDDINATLDFINWCVTSEQGTKAMADDMGFVIPFKNAVESPNVFVKADKEMTAAGKTPVAWNFSTMPSENWKNGVGSALTAYAAGTGSWDDVVTAFVDGWASEAALNAAA